VESAIAQADEADEAAVTRLVDSFYDRIRAEPRLGPIFENAIQDWDQHLQVMRDFWSRALLGTERYHGCVMSPHFGLPIDAVDLDRFLELFRPTADSTLPADTARRAIQVAEAVTQNLRRAVK